jgi:hypothetical protein
MSRSALLLLTFLALLTGLWISCAYQDSNPSAKGGTGFTEDVGVACYYKCDEVWCYKKNFPECSSQICVGNPDNLYCSILCLNDQSCPDGFRCTDLCKMDPLNSGYCVFDEHYETLIEFGACPEESGE